MRYGSKVVVVGILACCAFLLPLVAASAQQQGVAPAAPAAPAMQNVENVWATQAQWVAKDLSLTPELTTKLVDTYKAARQSHMKALQAQFGEGGGNRDMAAIRKVNDTERATFEAALNGFLKPEQTTKALATLGSFNRRWDRLVSALEGMKLDEATMSKAMGIVANFAADSDKAMRAAMDGGNMEGVRDSMLKMREKLDTDMAAVLTPEQLIQWKQVSAMRGGAGGRQERPAPAPAPAPAK